MKKKSRFLKVITFLLIFSITTQTTSIAQILMYFGVPEYLGGVGERIAAVANGSYAKAASRTLLPSLENEEVTDTGTGDAPATTPAPAPAPVINNYFLDCSCDLAGTLASAQRYADSVAQSAVATAASYTDSTVSTAMAAVQSAIATCEANILAEVGASEARLHAEMNAGFAAMESAIAAMAGSIVGAIRHLEGVVNAHFIQLLKDTNSILEAIGYEGDGWTVIALLKQLCKDTGEIKEDADDLNKIISELASSWFRVDTYQYDETASEQLKGRTYNMYYLVDKIHEVSTVIIPSLGYGTEDEATGGFKPNEDYDKPTKEYINRRIWLEMEQNSIATNLAQMNNNDIHTFGYYQYEELTEDEKTGEIRPLKISEFKPSLAKDFGTLLSYFKNYSVAEVYSANKELNANWQPTPDELNYSKERILNLGFANAYLGHWAVDTADNNNKTGYNARYEYILGKDILDSYEGYAYSVREVKDEYGDFKDYEIAVSRLTSDYNNPKLTDYLTLPEMFRILYRAAGVEIHTITTEFQYDADIKAETSPTVLGLSNISELNGYSCYISATRNNPIFRVGEGENAETTIQPVYVQRAKQDGFLGDVSLNDILHYEVTWADVWYYARAIMTRYGEEALNSTEIQSMLQLFGTHYPIQEGAAVADAWAYLKAKGCIATEHSATDKVLVSDFLDLSMRIKDKDSRLTYKNIQLVVNLDEAVVDTGYFPVFGQRIKAVDSYSNSITYDYAGASHYDVLIQLPDEIEALSDPNFMYISLRDNGKEPTGGEDNVSCVWASELGMLKLSIPFKRTDINGISITGKDQNNKNVKVSISSEYLGGGIVSTKQQNDGSYVAEKREYFPMSEDKYISFVDEERAGIDWEPATASKEEATLIDKIVSVAKFIFSPTYAKAAYYNGNAWVSNTTPASQSLSNNTAGSSLSTLTQTVENNSIAAAVLLACLCYENTEDTTFKWIYDNNMTNFGQYILKSMPGSLSEEDAVKHGEFAKFEKVVYKYYDILQETPAASINNKTYQGVSQNTTINDKISGVAKRAYDTFISPKFFSAGKVNNHTTGPYIVNIDILTDGRLSFRIVYSNRSVDQYNEIGSVISGASQAASSVVNATLESVNDIQSPENADIGQAGLGKIVNAHTVYADGIMNRDATYFVSYSSLVKQGIVSTLKTPRADEHGILSFYLNGRGRVTIDVNNHDVMVNSILIQYGDAEPVFTCDNEDSSELYINYACLVGMNINTNGQSLGYKDASEVGGVQVTTLKTITGAGANVEYQLATGIALDGFSTISKVGYRHYENESMDLPMYELTQYKNNPVKRKDNSRVILLSSTFPIGNWAIVEDSSERGELFVFYNRALFDNTYMLPGIAAENFYSATRAHLSLPVDSDRLGTDEVNLSESVVDKAATGILQTEASIYNRIQISGTTVLKEIGNIYGMPYDSVAQHPILAHTYLALARLAESTGVLIKNRDWYARSFQIDKITSLDKVETGKVYNLLDVGYVYIAPNKTTNTTENIFNDDETHPIYRWAMGDYSLPYYVTSNVQDAVILYDFNTNAYIDNTEVTHPESDEPVMKIYGTTVKTGYPPIPGDPSRMKFFRLGEMGEQDSEEYIYHPFELEVNKTVVAAPSGLYRYLLLSEPIDAVIISTITKYTTNSAYFYFGTKQLKYHSADTGTGVEFTDTSGVFPIVRIEGTEKAFVSTRDYLGKHHFILQPTMIPPDRVTINPVDANSYIFDYSQNPVYQKITQWLTDLDDTTTVLLRIIFEYVPYVMLIWILLLLAMALIAPKTVQAISKVVGVDLVSFLTLGRRELADWHGPKVVIPLIVAFVAMGLFYGPNLLKIIQIVSEFAYRLSGLR